MSRMKIVILHFLGGTLGSLIIFLIFTKLSGVKSFSAPFVVILIGIICASLAHFLSSWATVIVLVVYALLSANELRVDRAALQKLHKEKSPD